MINRNTLWILALPFFLAGIAKGGEETSPKQKAVPPLLIPRRTLGRAVPEWIHTDSFLNFGYSQVNRSSSLNYPMIMQWTAGLTAGYRMEEFEIPDFFNIRPFFGLTAELRYLGQYSAFDASVGNFRGTFLGFGPALGATVNRKWIFKLDPRFFGKYKLLNPTADNLEMSYGSPKGVRASLCYSLSRWTKRPLFSGFQFEYLSFTSRDIAGSETPPLSPPLTLWQAGWMLLYVF